MTGAKTAATIQKSTSPAPMAAGLDSVRRPRRRAQARAKPAGAAPGMAGRPLAVVGSATMPSAPEPRIEQTVGEIAEDLRQHRHRDRHQRPHLDEGDVLEEGSLQHHSAEAW